MGHIIVGALVMGFVVGSAFFLRFWRDTRDRLFLLFALSFLIMAANRLGLAFVPSGARAGEYVYWIRFAAFAVILIAVLDKNRSRTELL